MVRSKQKPLEPRKTPVQQRSTASVNAILQATIQVLLQVGKDRLTTTLVAHRAGVSVGTLYQYYPNKSALLQAALRRHLETVAEAVERVCVESESVPLAQRMQRMVQAFLQAKMQDLKASRAMYSVSSDVDGARIAQEMGVRIHRALLTVLMAAETPLQGEPQITASILQGALAGVSRGLLESASPEKRYPAVRQELLRMVQAYLSSVAE